MDNLRALKAICNAICSTFYPDYETMEIILFNAGICKDDEATPKNVKLLQAAIQLVKGYVENSRSENGVSTSVNVDAINENIRLWCKDYGLNAEDYLFSVKMIENGSILW